MQQTIVRIKPLSLGKIYGLVSATAVLLVGLIMNAFTVFFGQRAMTLSWQNVDFEGQLMMHTLTVKPVDILLLTCIATVVVLVIAFVWGTILGLLYNFSAGVGGGLQLELMNAPVAKSTVTAASAAPAATKAESGSVSKKTTAKKTTKKK